MSNNHHFFSGGMANRVFRVKLKPELAKQVKNAEPIEVIVRLYGTEMLKNLDAPKMLGDAGEILVFYIASQNNLGPKLIGVHDKCRIEEYIEVIKTIVFHQLNLSHHHAESKTFPRRAGKV